MKKSNNFYLGLAIIFLGISQFITSCQEDIVNDYPVPVNLITPLQDSIVAIDSESSSDFIFEWSELPDASGTVTYKVLFDIPDTYFETPLLVFNSDNDGMQTSLSLSHAMLDSIAVEAGIPAKKSGTVKWAVDAITGKDTITSIAGSIILKRPTSLGTIPTDLYIYGTATTAGNNPENAIRFHKISEGYFDLFTTLKSGTFTIANEASANAVTYFISEEELFLGDQTMEYDAEERLNLLQVNFQSAEARAVGVLSIDVIIPANGNTLTTLTDQGNNLYNASDVVFDFLVPGGPDSPDWLTWVEERYRFRMRTTGGDIFYGSYMDATMFGVYIQDMIAYSQRPEGDQPEGYYNVYAIPMDIDNYADWAGCYKLPSAADGNPIDITLNLDPNQPVYTHNIALAK